MHFGIISPPVSGHVHPFGALGRELIQRGHRVTLIHMADLEPKARSEGLEFAPIGQTDHPPGTLPASLAKLGRLDGMAALRFTIGEIQKTTEMMLRDAPAAISQCGIQALLVDQTEPAGSAIAEYLGIPFITVCNALALNREPNIPPPFAGWEYRPSMWARARNRIGYGMSDRFLRPVTRTINVWRKRWHLPAWRHSEQSFSTLAQISQQAPAFDYPRTQLPATFHYVGPLRSPSLTEVPFPWEKLDGRPVVYASLGTLQNAREQVFRMFAEACAELPLQLVIAHGGGLDERAAASLPGDPVVVGYAPQLEVLAKAALTLTHAGLNTVLDSLMCGVPLVAIPITYEQPAIAKRIAWCGAGKMVPFRKLTASRLRTATDEVLSNPDFLRGARALQRSIQQAGGVRRAADIVEQVIG